MVQVGGAWCARRVNCGEGGVVGGVGSVVRVGVGVSMGAGMVMMLVREVGGVVEAVRGGAGAMVLERLDALSA